MEALPCHIRRNKYVLKASAEPVRDQDKADIMRGGDLQIDVGDERVSRKHRVPRC